MSHFSFASAPCAKNDARRAVLNVCLDPAGRIRRAAQLIIVIAGAASLGACAQSSVVSKSEFSSGPREATLYRHHETHVANYGRVRVARKHTPFRTAKKDDSAKKEAKASTPSGGIASFYTADQETASGEKFDTHDLTA